MKHTSSSGRATRQQGFVLVMSLVFLLLLTILGVTAMTTTSLQEKMASNVKDKTLSFEAAESAVKLAETWLNSVDRTLFTNASQTNISPTDGITRKASDTDVPVWKAMDWSVSGGDLLVYPGLPWGTTTASALNTSVYAAAPRYIIEYLDNTNCSKRPVGGEDSYDESNRPKCNIVYVSARGVGGTTTAVSTVQSTVNVRAQ